VRTRPHQGTTLRHGCAASTSLVGGASVCEAYGYPHDRPRYPSPRSSALDCDFSSCRMAQMFWDDGALWPKDGGCEKPLKDGNPLRPSLCALC